ncbi:FAD-binding oxidoreductase (plasmid) [Agrobacterium cucumeris]|uniref:FAD-binding oxidoreductase n=3 Tax=Rhizobiaceae TaxID=82115 RepID=A0ABY8RX88_9HYPH|nr:FAD-binding oxidoreductase [Agrobacterium cucumeris]
MSAQSMDNGRQSPPLKGFWSQSDELPETADVVVIGAGIVGVSLALFLAKSGCTTVLLEKGRIGGEQSGRNLGWCRASGRSDAETPLGVLSMSLWDDFATTLESDTGFRRCGRLFLCRSAEEIAEQDRRAEITRRYGIYTARLVSSELKQFLPNASRSWPAAYYVPEDGKAEPELTVPVIAAGAQTAGAKVYPWCAVRKLEIAGGRVTGVITEKGRISCSRAVVTAGAWSSLFLRSAGLRLPIIQIAASVLRTAPVEGASGPCIGTADFGFRSHLDGSYSVSPFGGAVSLTPDTLRFAWKFLPALRQRGGAVSFRFDRGAREAWLRAIPGSRRRQLWYEQEREIDRDPSDGRLSQAFQSFLEARPDCAGASVIHRWAGVIDASPDSVPTIDAAPEITGLWFATGFSGHGFGLGPGAGRLLADMVTDAKPSVDPAPFRFRR